MSWCDGLEAICKQSVPLSAHTWYGLGGPARWFVTPRREEELAEVLRRCTRHEVAWRVLGHGANLLVRDAGFDGVVIHLASHEWESVCLDGPLVTAGAGADFPKLVKRTVEAGLGGLENLAGIPGSVGGIVRMNAGGKYGSIGTYVQRVRLASPDGRIEERTAERMGFAYRHTDVGRAVVTRVELRLEPGDRDEIMQRFRRIWNEKYASQPTVSARSCGCIFKNPPGHSAGRLIDEQGLKGACVGGAEISPRHANFIVAREGARAQDVLDLIALARDKVRAATGIELELEVEVW